MGTTKEYLSYVLEELSELDEITFRQMMGEYIIYYKGKIISYLCDNRCLIKKTPSSLRILESCPFDVPYEGAKEMILLEELNRSELKRLFDAMYPELPTPAVKKTKK